MKPRMRHLVVAGSLLAVSLGISASDSDLRISVVQSSGLIADPASVTHLTLRDGAVCRANKSGQCLSGSISVHEEQPGPDRSGVSLERDRENRVISASYLGYTYLVSVFDQQEPDVSAALRNAVDWIIVADSPHRLPMSVVLAELATAGNVPSEFRVLTDSGDHVTSFFVKFTR